MDPHLTWNLVTDVRQMLEYQFMVNALQAGTIVAVVAGAVGWFMVLRRESFAGHTLALIGFSGAAAATWLAIPVNFGYFGACIAAAVVIGWLTVGKGGNSTEKSAVIGIVQAYALAAGMLFIGLYKGFSSGLTSMLFGTIAGVSRSQVETLAVAAVVCLVGLVALGRPLLWTSFDPLTAAARGVPAVAVGIAFLVLLGVASAGTSQVTGSLLVFALLVAPPAAAQRLTANPVRSLVLSVVIALAVTWLGMTFAFYTTYPIGFWVASFGYGAYLCGIGAGSYLERRSRQPVRTPEPVAG
ncbi:metal ABC transporter permease [Jongsikchunia kroppenstedtii]|uniref:metal ABC transporter permease n=1 Tax=Jongsikchunia kroppenstedtii TaxID=1121721 RepID=UPI00036357C9|nr:metal ABC transporter permease [Jongsikchunia kroppenstedtii]